MLKQGLFILSWIVAGGLAFYTAQLHRSNIALTAELSALEEFRLRYQEQVAVNRQQREQFESRILQLQGNLRRSQVQMSNLSEALQEAREMMEPVARQVIEQIAGQADNLPQ